MEHPVTFLVRLLQIGHRCIIQSPTRYKSNLNLSKTSHNSQTDADKQTVVSKSRFTFTQFCTKW